LRQNSATAGPARVIWINGIFGAGGNPDRLWAGTQDIRGVC